MFVQPGVVCDVLCDGTRTCNEIPVVQRCTRDGDGFLIETWHRGLWDLKRRRV